MWSRTAAQVDLLLFDDVDDALPSRTIPLDPIRNRTSYFWHVLLPDAPPGQVYASSAFAAVAGLIRATLSHVIFVIGFGSSCIHPLFAKRPS